MYVTYTHFTSKTQPMCILEIYKCPLIIGLVPESPPLLALPLPIVSFYFLYCTNYHLSYNFKKVFFLPYYECQIWK